MVGAFLMDVVFLVFLVYVISGLGGVIFMCVCACVVVGLLILTGLREAGLVCSKCIFAGTGVFWVVNLLCLNMGLGAGFVRIFVYGSQLGYVVVACLCTESVRFC